MFLKSLIKKKKISDYIKVEKNLIIFIINLKIFEFDSGSNKCVKYE